MTEVEIRADKVIIRGYINAVERDSLPIPNVRGSFIEKVKAGTFKKALAESSNVELRYNHLKHLGSIKEGNLKLKEDNIGLYGVAEVTDDEVRKAAKENKLKGWSFGFVNKNDYWTEENGVSKRTLKDIKLNEVSILSVAPAYPATSIEARDNEDVLVETRAFVDEIHTNIEPEKEATEKDETRAETETKQEIDYSYYDAILKARKEEVLKWAK